jgi:hypothetical protein
LPVVPLLVCAVDATRRLGAFRLDGADVTLPVGALRVAAGGPLLRPGAVAGLLSTGRWYGGDAADAVPVTFRLAVGGQEDRTPPGPLSWLRALDQKVVRFPAAPGSGGAGALAAWSAEVIGWTAALVAEAARQAGVTGPVEFGVRRA